jgi:glyoxylase-like metal-dependent hydrolase (beta-lactamase superfamily II)
MLYLRENKEIVRMKIKTFVCNMLRENCYLIYDEVSREAAVVDAGFYWNEEKRKFSEFVEENNLLIRYQLCTHLHFDHVFGTAFIEDTYGVRVGASLDDKPWIDNFMVSVARFGIQPNDMPRPVGYPLHDGDVLHIGAEMLRCIATPGHSAGGMCFYVPDSGLLFSGDTLFQGGIGRTDFFDGNYAQLIRSIQAQLLILPNSTLVYPGHGDPTTIGEEILCNPYI